MSPYEVFKEKERIDYFTYLGIEKNILDEMIAKRESVESINRGKKWVEYYEYCLNHLDEIVPSAIAYRANQVLELFKNEYERSYKNVGNWFIGMIYRRGSRNILTLPGFTFDDYYSVFNGNDPTLPVTRDNFIKLVNQKYGINMPLTAEVEEAMREFDNVPSDENYCHRAEIMRDAGLLSCSDVFLDDNYLERKKKCSRGK